jgi:D-alanyl-D-alanine carboxypeptidase/D-alanyl-D-alanine-endopeptidase (penicillin-binding protein 4)
MARMVRLLRLACFVLAWACVAAGAQELPPSVQSALAAAGLPPDAFVALVAPAEGGPPRVAHRIDVPMNPASVAKLTTTFAALDLLGPAYSWQTAVYFDGPVRHGVLEGNLLLQGRGDPDLVIERLWLLLRRVQALGVHGIQGDIVLDRSAFAVTPRDPAAFDNQPLRPYNVSPDALLVNFKAVTLTLTPQGDRALVNAEPALAGVHWPASVPLARGACGDWITGLHADFHDLARIRLGGSFPSSCGERVWQIAFPDPQGYAGRAVAALWQQMGGKLDGQVRDGKAPEGAKPAFEFASPPLAEVIRDINKYSNNVMAQQVFLTLSLEQSGTGTFEGSREVLRNWWHSRLGTEPPHIENGSGLSRTDAISARQLGDLLRFAWASPWMPELASSLPVPGVDGTLQRRQQDIGRAHLKTGSLADVSAVAGYVEGPNGRRYVLVAIANHPQAPAARGAIEALIDWTAHQP